MSTAKSLARPTARSIASYVEKNAPQARHAQEHHHPSESVREADYKGHHIVIRTTYDIEVDGKPVTGHLGVTHDGQVHYHPVPNVSFASAVDLIKQLIDVFPDDFAPGAPAAAEHTHTHMTMKTPARRKATTSRRK